VGLAKRLARPTLPAAAGKRQGQPFSRSLIASANWSVASSGV
jgi:hypothetical protein